MAELAQEQADKLEITSEAVLLQVSRMAFVDVRRLVDDTGKPIPLHLLPDDVTAAIQDVVIKNDGGVQTYKVRLCDCLLYTSPSPRDRTRSRMPSSA